MPGHAPATGQFELDTSRLEYVTAASGQLPHACSTAACRPRGTHPPTRPPNPHTRTLTCPQDWLLLASKRMAKVEYALLVATFALVLFFGLEVGISAGIVLAALHFAYRCAAGGDRPAKPWAAFAKGGREGMLDANSEQLPCRCERGAAHRVAVTLTHPCCSYSRVHMTASTVVPSRSGAGEAGPLPPACPTPLPHHRCCAVGSSPAGLTPTLPS